MKLVSIPIVTILSLTLALSVKSVEINCSVGDSKYFCSMAIFTKYLTNLPSMCRL